eukprot:scaffold82968_cov36-Tisochrysis_lutea.AAC.1
MDQSLAKQPRPPSKAEQVCVLHATPVARRATRHTHTGVNKIIAIAWSVGGWWTMLESCHPNR